MDRITIVGRRWRWFEKTWCKGCEIPSREVSDIINYYHVCICVLIAAITSLGAPRAVKGLLRLGGALLIYSTGTSTVEVAAMVPP